MSIYSIRLLFLGLYTFITQLSASVHAEDTEKPLIAEKPAQKGSYAPGEAIVVECLNRTV